MSTQSTGDTNDKENSPLLTRNKIENTPFWIVGNENAGYKITWGKFTFTDEPFKTETDATLWFDTHPWEITLHLIAIGVAMNKDIQKKDTHIPE